MEAHPTMQELEEKLKILRKQKRKEYLRNYMREWMRKNKLKKINK